MVLVDLTMTNVMHMVAGVPEFTRLSLAFAYGKDSPALKENRVAGVQVNPEVSLVRCADVMSCHVPIPGLLKHGPLLQAQQIDRIGW